MISEQDKSLLACWRKKSIDVTAKLILYAAYGIDILAVGLLAILASVWAYENFYSPTVGLFNGIVSLVSLIIVFVPWYIWLGIIGVGGSVTTILAYAYAWCVAREFTDEDWKTTTDTVYDYILFPIVVIIFIIEVLYRPDRMRVRDYAALKVLTFPSAYLHYRKRIKGEKK